MTSKTYTKWSKRVIDAITPWTENDIIYFRKYIGSSGGTDDTQRNMLLTLFNSVVDGYSITPDQTTKGIDYLRNAIWTSKGKPRRTAKAKVFGSRERAIILDFNQFKFVGVQDISHSEYRFYVPVYRVIANNGAYFEYTTNMGNMVIVA